MPSLRTPNHRVRGNPAVPVPEISQHTRFQWHPQSRWPSRANDHTVDRADTHQRPENQSQCYLYPIPYSAVAEHSEMYSVPLWKRYLRSHMEHLAQHS